MAASDLPGRGASFDPASRFERLHVELDPDLDAAPEIDAATGEPIAARPPPTLLYRDASRSVLARNESPDVGFTWSLNPYRGCEHGCTYCLDPGTPILYSDMAWRPLGDVRPGDALVGFDEFPEPGRTRKLRRSIVEAVWWSRKKTHRLVTERSDVTTTAEHRWLQQRDFRWSRTEDLAPGRRLRGLPMAQPEALDDDYRAGYVAGLSLGDGTFRYEPGWRSNRLGYPQSYWRIALADVEPLVRAQEYLRCFGMDIGRRPFSRAAPGRRPLEKLETRSLPHLMTLHGLLHGERDTRSFRRGFIAGFFDAEGHSGNVLRISQVDLAVLERVRSYARTLGFHFALERGHGASALRLVGRLVDRMRFFSVCRPAILRKLEAVFGRELNADPETILALEDGPRRDVVDIQTSTRTFFAAGLATHNCYARPSHEYLGFGAGLDFERRILVKDDAPALLRKTFLAPRWQPDVVALSGNTDCYQPIERKLELTRRCLEVFAEFRNPVAVITKSALVARDADLLGALARERAAQVFCSVTTLDPDLARRMEPRAAIPDRRLEAIARLAAAGVPVGVMVAPVIPGLNDAEMPRILEAAARAGARSASWVLLRLAPPIDQIFLRWLDERLPEKKQRILSHIRATRDGRLSDSRFGRRMRGEGEYAAQIAALFAASARKHGLGERLPALETGAFRRPAAPGEQLRLL